MLRNQENRIKYSQNFLKSSELAEKLINKISWEKDDWIFEIGPGEGILTNKLLAVAGKITIIEIDENLVRKLKDRYQSNKKVEVIQKDFLKYSLPKIGNYKIFSNIPFNITNDILKKIINSDNPPRQAHLFVQREAAEKMIGLDYGEKETQLSVISKSKFDIKVTYKFNKRDFFPIPRVEIVLLSLFLKKELDINLADQTMFRDFVSYTFNKWTPTVGAALRDIFSQKQVRLIEKKMTGSFNLKPSQLTYADWLILFEAFNHHVDLSKKNEVIGYERKLRLREIKLSKIHRTRIANNWKDSIR